MLTDYNTKKKRLTKKDLSADFRLADSDDFFGFISESKSTLLDWIKRIAITILVLAVGYVFLYFVLALTPNI